jgi:hypothetical protein
MKYRAKINARKLPCPGVLKTGKPCSFKYDPVKSYACGRHMKTLVRPDDWSPPEPREPRVTSSRPKKVKKNLPIDHIEGRLTTGEIVSLWEDRMHMYPTEVLKIWRDKIIPHMLNKLKQCDKDMYHFYVLCKYSKLIDATLESRSE